MEAAKAQIFLSYARPDREQAVAVKVVLELTGAMVFLDAHDIEPGEKWEKELYANLATRTMLCIYWTANAARSRWVELEYTYFTTQFPRRQCVPLCADETPLPEVLAAYQAPPEFLALPNEIVALRRDLEARGVSRREIRSVVRKRLKARGLTPTVAQWWSLRAFVGGGSAFLLFFTHQWKPLLAKLGAGLVLVGALATILGTWCKSGDAPLERSTERLAAEPSSTSPHGRALRAADPPPTLVGSDPPPALGTTPIIPPPPPSPTPIAVPRAGSASTTSGRARRVASSTPLEQSEECLEVGWRDRAGMWRYYRAWVDEERENVLNLHYDYHHGKLELDVYRRMDHDDLVEFHGRWFEGRDAERAGRVHLALKQGEHRASGWYTFGDDPNRPHYDFRLRDCPKKRADDAGESP